MTPARNCSVSLSVTLGMLPNGEEKENHPWLGKHVFLFHCKRLNGPSQHNWSHMFAFDSPGMTSGAFEKAGQMFHVMKIVTAANCAPGQAGPRAPCLSVMSLSDLREEWVLSVFLPRRGHTGSSGL